MSLHIYLFFFNKKKTCLVIKNLPTEFLIVISSRNVTKKFTDPISVSKNEQNFKIDFIFPLFLSFSSYFSSHALPSPLPPASPLPSSLSCTAFFGLKPSQACSVVAVAHHHSLSFNVWFFLLPLISSSPLLLSTSNLLFSSSPLLSALLGLSFGCHRPSPLVLINSFASTTI